VREWAQLGRDRPCLDGGYGASTIASADSSSGTATSGNGMKPEYGDLRVYYDNPAAGIRAAGALYTSPTSVFDIASLTDLAVVRRRLYQRAAVAFTVLGVVVAAGAVATLLVRPMWATWLGAAVGMGALVVIALVVRRRSEVEYQLRARCVGNKVVLLRSRDDLLVQEVYGGLRHALVMTRPNLDDWLGKS
jgi:Family of unknown function (DUF6232)